MSKVRFSYTDGSTPLDLEMSTSSALPGSYSEPTRVTLRRRGRDGEGAVRSGIWEMRFNDVASGLAALDLAEDTHVIVHNYITRDQNGTYNGTFTKKVRLTEEFRAVSSVTVVA